MSDGSAYRLLKSQDAGSVLGGILQTTEFSLEVETIERSDEASGSHKRHGYQPGPTQDSAVSALSDSWPRRLCADRPTPKYSTSYQDDW